MICPHPGLLPRRLPAKARLWTVLLLGGILPWGLAQAAWAERPVGLQFCAVDQEPRSADILIAIAYQERSEVLGIPSLDWVSQGWYTLPKDSSLSCVTVLDQPLEQRYYYYFAYSDDPAGAMPQSRWDGRHRFCLVPGQAFRLATADLDCASRRGSPGAIPQGFREIDTLGAEGYRAIVQSLK
jgi:uncharacterized membrane protein